ncbi:hypothetical protein [Pelomonas aquatica]|jgi:hypothetical protein|uniref:Uncharacterized protein n=2 Tax=Pelomonas aquatica TaxID=431058 RepID=A0A9X4R3P3_9BURK|nr:hypothetical protein [Pelomonas aquatica]MCY4755459.1 hypothetical protein [Pelomonas aquatica]MDG0861675.1 hypothetical protein [Pelomonas aquatica]
MRRSMSPTTLLGQATVEFVVAALVLVPLFIAIPLLGKYADLFQATEAASRYVAFEGMARNSSSSWKSDAELSLEVRRRFFSNSDAPVKTGDAAGDFTANRNPMWSDNAGRPLLAKFEDDVKVSTSVSDKNAVVATKAFAPLLGLGTHNWYDATVTIKPADIPNFAPFDKIGLSTTRRTVLLADAWTARNNGQIRSRIENGGVLVYPIGQIKPVVALIGLIPPMVNDPAIVVSAFDWDVVPCDRLVGGC